MRKIIISVSLLVMALMFTTAGAAAPKQISVQVNGKEVSFPDAKPYTENERVLIPVRFVSEALGAEVSYKNNTVVIKQDSKTIVMKTNTRTITVAGKPLTLDVPARVKQNRTFVPLRFVSEALEAKVDWNREKLLVSITTKDAGTDEPGKDPNQQSGSGEAFKWGTYTDLGKALFADNMKIVKGSLEFTIPANTEAVWYTSGNGNGEDLKPGKYTKALGDGQGYLMITKIYAGKDYVEGYAVYLDSNNETLNGAYSGLKGDGVVSTTLVINGKMVDTSAPLSDVIEAAKQL